MKTLSRRTLLRGARDVAVALPFLEAMLPARASAATAPKRFLAWFTGSGNIVAKWRPSGSERSFTLGPITAPLEAHKDKLVFVDGLQIRGQNGEGHTDGMGSQLTGMPLNPKAGGTGFASGISMDQVLANRNAGKTRFKSLEVSVGSKPGNTWGRMSYLGSNQPIPPEGSPTNLFKRVFSGVTAGGGTTGVTDLRDQKRTVLDAVREDYAALSRRLGGGDRQRLDAHLTAIREIETRLDTVGATVGTCKPVAPTSSSDFPTIGKLQMDLIVMAFACDLTRVGSLMWEHAAENRRHPWVGVSDEHHMGFHNGRFDAVQKIMTWYSQQFAYLLTKLRGVPDGTGTLLDNTVVFWTSEQANGHNHSKQNMPYLLAGGAGGAIKTGRWLRYSGLPSHNDLLVSLLNAMDVPVTTFGKSDWCKGPLSGLVG